MNKTTEPTYIIKESQANAFNYKGAKKQKRSDVGYLRHQSDEVKCKHYGFRNDLMCREIVSNEHYQRS